jgi:hypothetical protein
VCRYGSVVVSGMCTKIPLIVFVSWVVGFNRSATISIYNGIPIIVKLCFILTCSVVVGMLSSRGPYPPKTTTVRPKQRSTVGTIPSSASTTTLPQTSTTIKPVSIFRYLVEKRTRPATNQCSYSPPIYLKTTTTKSTPRNEGPRDDNIPTTTEQVKMKHSVVLALLGIVPTVLRCLGLTVVVFGGLH